MQSKQNSIIINNIDTSKQKDIFSGKVLLVEDNKINQIVATQNLKKFKLNVTCVENGKIAVEKVKQHHYDMVLMDLHMPIMNGFEATSLIRKFNQNIPIVALSAAVMKEDIERTIKVGMNEHLAKPIDLIALKKILEKYLEKNTCSINKNSKEINISNKRKIIKGINLQELLERFNQKEDLAYQSLISFAINKKDTYNKLETLVPDSKEFEELIHNIKGLSGNLSFTDVFKYSSKIYQTQSLQKRKELTPLLINSLKIVLKSINENIITHYSKKNNQKEYSYDEYKIELKTLNTKIAEGSFISQTQINAIVNQTKLFTNLILAENLETQLSSYDYNAAIITIKEIKKNINNFK